jgi:hypothetical protein
MSLSVEKRAENVATFRFVQVFLMETLARWTPATPELEVKVLFGRHIWDLAQQADALGKRTYELRAPLQSSLRPTEGYVRLLEDFSRTASTSEKIHGFYEVMLPGLAARYRAYLAQTDRLLDEPTVRVVERILEEFNRMQDESRRLRVELAQLPLADQAWLSRLAQLEAAETSIIAQRSAAAVA